jgi:hypothetical protein
MIATFSMHLWTNGEAHLLATGRGIARVAPSPKVLHRFSLSKVARTAEPADLDFFEVLDDGGSRGILGRDGVVHAFTVSDDRAHVQALESPSVRAAVSAGTSLIVCAAGPADPDGRTRCALFRANATESSLVLQDKIALPEAKRITWPGGIWAKGAVPWPEEDDEPDPDEPFEPNALDVRLAAGSFQGSVRLRANAFGVVATSTYSGIVVVLEPDSLKPRCVLRLPTQAETTLSAIATREGVLVAVVVEGRQSALLHLSPSGEVLGSVAKFGKEAAHALKGPLLLSDDRALLTQGQSGTDAFEVRLPELKATKLKLELADRAELLAYAQASSTTPAAVAAFGDPATPPHKWALARLEPKAKGVTRTDLATPDLREPTAPPGLSAPAGAPRASGQPTLALMAKVGGGWTCAREADLLLNLVVSSAGGRVRGIYVELGGPALASGLVGAGAVTCGSEVTAFALRGTAARCEIPATMMDAGFLPPPSGKGHPPPPPNPSLELQVSLRGLKAGQGLLTVRVGPLTNTGTAGSAMQGKNLVVTG